MNDEWQRVPIKSWWRNNNEKITFTQTLTVSTGKRINGHQNRNGIGRNEIKKCGIHFYVPYILNVEMKCVHMLHKKLIHREFGRRQKIAILSHLVTFEIDEKLCLAFHSKKKSLLSLFHSVWVVFVVVVVIHFASNQVFYDVGHYSCIDLRLHDMAKKNEYAEKSAQNLPEIKAKEKNANV